MENKHLHLLCLVLVLECLLPAVRAGWAALLVFLAVFLSALFLGCCCHVEYQSRTGHGRVLDTAELSSSRLYCTTDFLSVKGIFPES